MKCNCDEFETGLDAIHRSCEQAALNGVGIKLPVIRFCPWCGGGVGDESKIKHDEDDRPTDNVVVIRVLCPNCGWSVDLPMDENDDIGVCCDDCGGEVKWFEAGVLFVQDEIKEKIDDKRT